MPSIHADRLAARIDRASRAFARGETADGRPYPAAQRKQDEAGLRVTPDMRDMYLMAADWGFRTDTITGSEYQRIRDALTGVGVDPATGWHTSADLAVKVVITKMVNELLEARGDA